MLKELKYVFGVKVNKMAKSTVSSILCKCDIKAKRNKTSNIGQECSCKITRDFGRKLTSKTIRSGIVLIE